MQKLPETLDERQMPWRSFAGTLREVMRYGENPHQWAAFYATGETRLLSNWHPRLTRWPGPLLVAR